MQQSKWEVSEVASLWNNGRKTWRCMHSPLTTNHFYYTFFFFWFFFFWFSNWRINLISEPLMSFCLGHLLSLLTMPGKFAKLHIHIRRGFDKLFSDHVCIFATKTYTVMLISHFFLSTGLPFLARLYKGIGSYWCHKMWALTWALVTL